MFHRALHDIRHSQWFRRLTRRLPGYSGRFGPPRRSASVADYAQAHGLSCATIPASPAQTLEPVRFFGPAVSFIMGDAGKATPAVHVIELAGGRLLWPEGSVVTADDCLLWDTSFWAVCDHGRLHRHPATLRLRAPPQRHLPGRTLSLASDNAHESFGHFILDALPRLDYLREVGFRPADFDWIVLHHPKSDTVERLIAAAKIPPEKIVQQAAYEDLVCERLVCTTFPASPGVYTPRLTRFYREILQLDRPGRRRLYLSRQRQSRRRLHEPAATEALLARYGFETIYPETDEAIIAKCAEAEFIVGIEGSNFTNQVFAPPGGAVLVLVASNWLDLPYVYSVATAAGKKVYAVGCTPYLEKGDTRSHWTNPHDLIVDCAVFEEALKAMLA